MNAADTCRSNGWTVGSRLIGDEGYGPTAIEITAIGREQVLAVTVDINGDWPYPRREAAWDLSCRDWKPIGAHCSVCAEIGGTQDVPAELDPMTSRAHRTATHDDEGTGR